MKVIRISACWTYNPLGHDLACPYYRHEYHLVFGYCEITKDRVVSAEDMQTFCPLEDAPNLSKEVKEE